MSETNSIKRRGLMLVLSSPSGAGKTTISHMLLESDGNIALSVSVTTRKPREKEIDGKDYFFISEEEFKRDVEKGGLLEHACVFGNHYGTPKSAVERNLEKGKDVLFDIDWQGTQQLAEKARDDLVSVFILPPSWEELERRLRTRALDDDKTIRRRMDEAMSEISHWAEYDYVIVNRDLNESANAVKSILLSERLKRRRMTGLSDFVKGLKKGG